MYYGNTRDVVSYFQSIGFDFPERTLTAEHVIDIVNTDYGETTIENSAERCAEAWPKSEYYKRLMAQLESMAIFESIITASVFKPNMMALLIVCSIAHRYYGIFFLSGSASWKSTWNSKKLSNNISVLLRIPRLLKPIIVLHSLIRIFFLIFQFEISLLFPFLPV